MPYINSLSIGNWWKEEAERKNLKMTGKMHRKRKRKNDKNFHISFGTELNCVRIQKKANWIKTTRIQPEKEGKKIIYLLHLIRMRLDVCSFVRLLVCLFALFFVCNDSCAGTGRFEWFTMLLLLNYSHQKYSHPKVNSEIAVSFMHSFIIHDIYDEYESSGCLSHSQSGCGFQWSFFSVNICTYIHCSIVLLVCILNYKMSRKKGDDDWNNFSMWLPAESTQPFHSNSIQFNSTLFVW